MPLPIIPRTPRTEMLKGALFRKMQNFYKTLAEDEGVEVEVLDAELIKFGEISIRVRHSELDAPWDFEPATPKDTDEALKQKFLAYLDSTQVERLREVSRALFELDEPADEVTAPDPPQDKKKG